MINEEDICNAFQEKWAREESAETKNSCISPVFPQPLGNASITPPSTPLTCTYVNVNGREEHEKIIRDAEKCKELQLDQMFEITVYLKRWGGWLDAKSKTYPKNC